MKNLLRSKKGQAVFEFILFLPFMLLVYSVVVTICGAINGSINQQKATRGYLFARIKNNSNVPLINNLDSYSGVRSAGMVTIGWRKTSINNDQPVAPCYKIISFFQSGSSDTCLSDPSGNSTSQFIRVKTAFGICGNTYDINAPNEFFRSGTQANYRSCTLSEVPLGSPLAL